MKTKIPAIIIGLAMLLFIAPFIWVATRPPAPVQTTDATVAAAASARATLSDGRMDIQVFALGDRNVRLEIVFTPDADTAETAGLRPDVNVAMLEMHMDGIDPPLELVEAGIWRARLQLPMAGRWVVSVGFGDDRTEVEFDAI